MKKNIIISVIVVLAVAVSGYFLFFKSDDKEVIVETTVVKKGTISNTVTATGTIEPLTQVEVGTQVSGVIEKLYADYNSEVKKGQLIAELDKTALKAVVAEAQASMTSAKNEREYRQKNFDRIKKLYDSKTVSEVEYEEALYNLNNAKSALEQRVSELNRARTNLSYASIYSPVDGVVLSRSVDEGQTVAASYSTPTLFTIAQDLTKMQVEADVDEADIGHVKKGQRVTFTVDAYPEDEFKGTVTQVRIEPTIESNVVTYTVIIEAENPDYKLMPGLTASIIVYTQEVADIPMLELKALRFQPDNSVMLAYRETTGKDQSNAFSVAAADARAMPGNNPSDSPSQEKNKDEAEVWIKEGAIVYPAKIKTGLSDGINVEVKNGLKIGDTVVFSMSVSKVTENASPGETQTSPFMPSRPGATKKK